MIAETLNFKIQWKSDSSKNQLDLINRYYIIVYHVIVVFMKLSVPELISEKIEKT